MSNAHYSRRKFFKFTASTAATALLVSPAMARELAPTAKQDEGPYYPKHQQPDKDAVMTRVAGQSGQAEGEVIVVKGRVQDTDGNPVANAVIDIWQADSNGRYMHEDAPDSSPLDPNFQYWAQLKTGDSGEYSIETIKPGKYPAMGDWVRPPHIHFKIARRGYRELITQMYFSGESLNEVDRLYLAAPEEQRPSIVVDFVDGTGVFDIVLETA